MVLDFIVNNVEFFVFALALSVFLYVKRKNVDVQGSFPFLYFLMYRTKLGLDKMDRWSKKHPKVFLYLSYLSVFVGIVGMILIFVFMFWQLGFIVEKEITAGGGFVLPIKTESGLESPVPVFYVPFWYWIVALFILATVHEFAHGVIAERFGVKVKSSGFAFLGIGLPLVPAAFVEPDEKSLEKKPRWQQIAVLGAGSTSNFIFGFLFLALWIFAAGPLIDKTMEVESVSFSSVMNESSLSQYNISSGEILALDGVYDKEKFLYDIRNLSVNSTHVLTMNVSGVVGDYEFVTFENSQVSGKGMIGIAGLSIVSVNSEGYEYLGNFPLAFEKMLFWVWFLNIGIGMMNLLPLWITDGGRICYTMLHAKLKKVNAVKVYNLISLASLVLIIFTIWPSLLYSLLGLFG